MLSLQGLQLEKHGIQTYLLQQQVVVNQPGCTVPVPL